MWCLLTPASQGQRDLQIQRRLIAPKILKTSFCFVCEGKSQIDVDFLLMSDQISEQQMSSALERYVGLFQFVSEHFSLQTLDMKDQFPGVVHGLFYCKIKSII